MSALERPHVLIVSDDRGLSDFLGEGLVYAGLWTSVIASAVQALEVFRIRSFDLLLIDAALGGIGASELVRRLRGTSDRATPAARTEIPIFLLAGSPEEVDSGPGRRAGADKIVVAPIEIAELAELIVRAVSSWRVEHPGLPWADAAALGEPRT